MKHYSPFAGLLSLALLGSAMPVVAQTVILREDFENRTGTAPIRVNTYTGTTPAGSSYTAAPVYLASCNGWVAKWNDPNASPAANAQITDCQSSQANWEGALAIPQALGVLNGQTLAAAKNNLALTAYTSAGGYSPTDIEIQSSQAPLTAIPAGGSGRFITFGVDGAAQNCFATSPQFQFYVLTPGNVETAVGGVLNVCSDPRGSTITVNDRNSNAQSVSTRVVRLIASASTLYTGGASVAVRMRNTAATAGGNDGGIDNLQILDVTPTLSKTAAARTYVGQAQALTFTVTNTPGDNLAKTGWSFTDTLPANVTVATPNGLTNTCGGTVTAAAGSGSIAIANGTLPAGTAGGTASTCTIRVNVVSNIAGSYSNGAGNIGASVGLNLPPAPAVMEWVQNRLTLTKISQNGVGTFGFAGNNGIAAHNIVTTTAGTGVAGAQQLLTVGSTTANTTITETQPTTEWQLTAVSCTGLAAGQSASFTGNTITLPFAGLALQAGGRDVQCTVTNTRILPPPTLQLTKALGRDRTAATDQFTMQIRTGSASGPVVSSATNATTAGTNATVTAGTGTTGTFTAVAGTQYFLTEAASGTTALANYDATITCTDANGLQAGLPSGATFSGSLAITPVAGAAIACTLTNTSNTVDLAITKTNTPGVNNNIDQANDTVVRGPTTYTLVVRNSGPATVTGAVVTDTPIAGIACPAGNAVSIDYSGATPDASSDVGTLTSAGGIVLGVLAPNETATLVFTCNVN